eukprot:4917877-Pyramimonas_sp.AAC.1
MAKKPKGDNDDFTYSSLLRGFHRPDFSLPRTNRDRVPDFGELVLQDERDDLAQSRGVDFIDRGARTREQHTLTSCSARGRSSMAPRAGRSSSKGFGALGSP